MAKRRELKLTSVERAYLEDVRDHDRRAYLREKAAALLKIADGMSPHAVARHGLLKPRDPDTIYAWMSRFAVDHVLKPRPNCRRRFSP